MTATAPRFRLIGPERAMLETAWRTWLDAITQGYFAAKRTHVDHQAITVEALALGLTWFALKSGGRRLRGTRRVARLNLRGRFGPGHDVRDGCVEALADAVLEFAVHVRDEHLPGVDRIVASCAIGAAAIEAAVAFFERQGYAKGAAETLRLELLDWSPGEMFAA